VTARRPKSFKVHWRGAQPVAAARIPQPFPAGTQATVPRSQLFAGRVPLTPFFAFLSGLSQCSPPGTQLVARSSDQQFVNQRPLTPLFGFTSGIRLLVLGLVLGALVPNVILGGLFWLGAINAPWSKPVTFAPNKSRVPANRIAVRPPVLSSPALLEATAGEPVSLPIALDGTDGVPVRSIIAISGLPRGSMLSSGSPYGESEWNLKTDDIGDLQLVLPNIASGVAKLIFQLVAPDGTVIADTATVLNIAPDRQVDIGASNINPTQAQVLNVQEPQATGVAESPANLGTAIPTEAPVPLPSRRPTLTTNYGDRVNWIKPSTFVNLREGPSPLSRVISVVAKGTKLRVIGRKNRWVQVTNPATSEKGWVYAAKVATMP
jgi:hypothetical protein